MKFISVMISLLIPFIFTSCQKQDKSIILGAIYNLHNSQASLDIAASHGVELAVSEINAEGGLNGIPIRLILKDGFSNPDSIKKATQELIKHKAVTIIGFSDTDMVLAAEHQISKAGIPFITSGATAPILVKKVPDVLFLSCFGDNVQAAAGAEFAKTTLKRKDVFIISDKNMDYSKYLVQYFRQSWTALNGTLVQEASYAGDLIDSLNIINSLLKVKNRYDLIYLAAGPDDVGNWIRMIRKAGILQPILGGDAYDTPLLIKNAGTSADNIFFTTHAWMSRKGSPNGIRDFVSVYHEMYGVDPENSFAALGYDSVMLFAHAAKRAKKIQPEYLLEAIEQTTDFSGLTGKVRFINGSHIPSKEVMIVAIKKGEYSLDAVIMPEHIPTP